MQVEIITPDKKLFAGEATLVAVPGSQGAFEILKDHAPIISTLEAGTIRVVTEDGQESHFEIKKGVVECLNNQINVLVES